MRRRGNAAAAAVFFAGPESASTGGGFRWPTLNRSHTTTLLSGVLLGLVFAGTGCGLQEIGKQTTLADNVGSIRGKILVAGEQKGPVRVLRFRDENGISVLERSLTASEEGEYEVYAGPGKHYIAAFIDADGDGRYQPGEHGNYFGAPTALEIGEGQEVRLGPITISGTIPKPPVEIEPIDRTLAVWRNIGKVVALDDPRFTPENYAMGFWKPLDFLAEAEGGLFFLQEYRQDKVPVLFIHGVLNGPTLWTKVIEGMDRTHFQPWMFYYPSALRLDIISDYLVDAVAELESRYGFKKLCVVAHSMGGLVARSFVKKYVERNPATAGIPSLVVTVNSPMAGMSSAASGVEHSPILVPCWRDVEPGSEFLHRLNVWAWPKEIPYHLVISYRDGDSGDGVVSLQSQCQPKLQAEASRIHIFNNDHSGTVNDRDFLAMLNRILWDGL